MPTHSPRTVHSLLSASALASALLLAACGQGSGDAQHGGAPGGAPEVSVITIAPQAITLTSELSGRTTAFLIADVRPQVSGIVKARLFTEGGDVKAGQTLYQIDAAPFEAALASAKATLAKAEANVQTLKLKAARYDELAGIDAVSKQDRDDTRGGRDTARDGDGATEGGSLTHAAHDIGRGVSALGDGTPRRAGRRNGIKGLAGFALPRGGIALLFCATFRKLMGH